MAVCQFFLRGQCRFGDGCRNEHTAEARQPAFGGNAWNRPAGSTAAASGSTTSLPYNAGNIANDLNPQTDKPNWPLSSYAPFKHETLLITGLDESPEELRVRAATAMRAGNLNEYLSYEANQIAAAEQVYNNVRTNSEQAFQQASKQSTLIPNPTSTTSAFGSGTGTSGSAFPSASSAFGSTSTAAPSAFGSTATPSVFGSTTTSTPSAFGSTTTTPSAFGALASNNTSAFGKSTFGQSAFGQTAAPAAASTTSAFGQPAAPVSAFGQPAQGLTTSAFGQPAFGQPSQPGGGTGLIKPASGAFGAFAGSGASPFGAGATPSTTTSTTSGGGAFSAFAGQPSAFGTQPQGGGSVFGQPSFGQPAPGAQAQPANTTTTSVFGQPAGPSTTTSSVFGAPSAFGQQQPQQSAFSVFNSGNTTGNTTSVFGQGSFGATAPPQQAASAFGGGQTQSAFGNLNTTASNQQSISAFAPAPQSTTLSVPSIAPAPSISMASSSSGGPAPSPFGATPGAPSSISTFNPGFAPTLFNANTNPPSSSKSSSSQHPTVLDFSGLIARTAYRPDATPYDAQLPENYAGLLPARVREAFQSEKFGWGWKSQGGGVPEWIPPVNVR